MTVSKTLELWMKLPTLIVFPSPTPLLPRVETAKAILLSHSSAVEKVTRETKVIKAIRVTVEVVDRLALEQVDLDLELQVVVLPLDKALEELEALDTVY